MTSPQVPPPDQAARDRIVNDLETSFLVEAGAGAGKTTQLVLRMVALISSGTATVDQIAAVTFTRKAAAELRERFQAALEERLRVADAGGEEWQRLSTAVERIESAFLGTIHAFAARLLRERPLEAGLDPAFQEVLETEAHQDARNFWFGHLERLAADGSSLLEDLVAVGLRPNELENAFHRLVDNLDVTFPAADAPMPSSAQIEPVRRELESLLDEATRLLPAEEPTGGWDSTQTKVRSALYLRRRFGWDDPEVFFESLYSFAMAGFKFVMKRWSGGGTATKALRTRFEELREDPAAIALLEQWLAFRYAPTIRFLVDAAERFRDHRRRQGRLNFQDLLTFTLDLLRSEPVARRDLGDRFRWLLVDEFQDTDPLQAELVFLLASEPTAEDMEGSPPDWRTAQPRPGALFMVGDPKQSIYRFRRADIAVYNYVRERMIRNGSLLGLDANFRSLLPIAGIVNDVFSGTFPADGSRHQAPFAPLRPQRAAFGEAPPVMVYEAPYKGHWNGADGEADAGRIASWIQHRVESGEREAGDFLILVWRKKHLQRYARALEARRLPIDVTGAGVGFRHDLDEFLALLAALADPDDATKVVAALGGLFMGMDAERLAAHGLGGGRFALLLGGPDPQGDEQVLAQLARLTGWWEKSRVQPADIFVGELLDELGLMPHAAAAELGALRAGAMAYVMDVVRATAAGGDTSLVGITESIQTSLDWEEAEAPLDPGRGDAVRLMNVHKAKGLQAPVVILAGPGGYRYRGQELHITRTPDGTALGYLQIQRSEGWTRVPVARPSNWRELEDEEERFGTAEELRLLYVAVTRAEDELLVGRAPGRSSASPWGALDSWLEVHARKEDLALNLSDGTRLVGSSIQQVERTTRVVETARAERAVPTYRFDSVSTLAKSGRAESPEGIPVPRTNPTAEPTGRQTARGYEWGSIVHAALAEAARNAEPAIRRRALVSLLTESDRPLLPDGSPRELNELIALVEGVRGSELWERALASDSSFAEMPFALRLEGGAGDPHQFVEGVIDLVFKDGDHWVIADYKTDIGDDPDFPDRRSAYRAQVDLYARCWSQLTGQEVSERLLVFTSRGEVERW